MDLSEYVLEPVHADEALALYRGRRRVPTASSDSSILLIRPVSEHPAPATLKRLGHEYSLAGELDSAWAARPVALTEHQGRTTLVLEDFGGASLDALLGTPMQVGLFLRVAVGLAAALRQLHARGIIHKDVKPANALVDTATGRVWLTGFGIASRLRRERQAPEPPEVIAGTLPYMAPEQTGRMNRSIDSRSDLYSLGVVLYQMATGSLPFTASDPMELVHCHIARKPIPPRERIGDLPAPVSDVIMKLLAKTPEERYQTAAGAEADLRRCLADWESRRSLDPFPLGEHDRRDRLVIPEKLYGRDREIATLLSSFDEVLATGAPTLVLVAGYSGSGKSSVVNELHKVLVPPRGLFASGKFDQYKTDIPFASLAQAFQSLIRRLLSKPEAELDQWRAALSEALGADGSLMLDLAPELKLIVGEQPPVVELPALEAQRRFQLVVRRFVGVFARPEHPLALFLDDLQWLDAATLDLLGDLLTAGEVRHLLLIGAYRDNQVTESHPLARKLDALRKAGSTIRTVTLLPLTLDDVQQLIADALHATPDRMRPLAELVHGKTGGNPLFAIQFLSSLAEEGLLTFDHGAAQWSWDQERTLVKGYTDNVVDLMVRKLARLPDATRQTLQRLACLGSVADYTTVCVACEKPAEAVESDLSEALRQEMVLHTESAYRFVHDRVQEAAYSLIPQESRAQLHLQIGRQLVAHTPADRRKEAVFEIVNQLNRGAGLVTAPAEREQLAELNLLAGKRSKSTTAYASALGYLEAGDTLLPADRWERRHELAFSLEYGRAECEFLTGDLAAAAQRLTALWARDLDAVERAAVTCLRIDVHVNLGQSGEAIAAGLDYLRRLSVEWSPHPTPEEARREYALVWATLGDRPIEELIDLPLMSDATYRGAVDVLITLTTPAWLTDPNLLSLVTCRAVNLSLAHGNCDGSCVAYVMLGVVAGPQFGDYHAGYRFSSLAHELVEQRQLTRFRARTYLFFGHLVLPWTKHVRLGRELVWRAYDDAKKVGNLVFAAISAQHVNVSMLAAGDPLEDTQRQIESSLEFSERRGFALVVLTIVPQLGMVRSLRGLTRTFGTFDDGPIDEAQLEGLLGSNPIFAVAECFYWVRKLQTRFLAGDYAAAIAAASRAQRLLWSATAEQETAEYHFYGALSLAASCDSAPADARADLREALAAHHRQLAVWAETCPENFENRVELVAAEIARLEERDIEAMRHYDRAIRSAQASGFVHNEALANELAGRFYTQRGFEEIARLHLRNARHAYVRWGAQGKARQLDGLYPYLREVQPTSPASTIVAPIDQLDLATVVKVSEAVSGEIVLERLIEALLRTATEHAGAERGLLVLPRGNELAIEAEANTDGAMVTVRLREAPVSSCELAESVVRYAARTQASVILDDASAASAFSADEYIRRANARSILCLPLVKQGRLVALLYLENSLTPNVFTPARTAVLKLLASQAAIALENGRLYRELQVREAKIRRLVDANIVGVLISNLDQVIEANDAFLDIVGLARDDLDSGRIKWTELTPPEWQSATERAVTQLRATGCAELFEKEYFRKDGSRVPVLVAAAALEGNQSVAFVVDLTERKQAEAERERLRELRRAKEVAEMANRAKDQFMANVSHEIRTPMNAILGMTELALEQSVGPEQRLSLSTVKSAAENLLVIIEDLLDFAKIEAGKVELANEPFSLREVVRDCVRALAIGAHGKGLDLICDVAAEVPDQIKGDAVRLRQVLVNLVGNAIKFTARGEIAVTVGLAAEGFRFSVRDTGIGIARDKQRAIFDAFEQADDSTVRRYGGTGLGLNIAARLVQLMGGKIDVDSEPGQGSTFTFTAQLAVRAPAAANPPPAALAGVRVLVADDNRSTGEVVERWLQSWGMEPKVVSGAPQVVASLREERFALAVIDAGMDGLTPITGTRVVYLGAIELPETQARFRQLGGDARVAKPAMPEELQAAVLLALRGRETTGAPVLAPLIVRRPLRILVADDNELNQELMWRLLATRGHDVTIAANGRKAIAQVESSVFDVLLLDVHLPELDGFGVIKAVRERERETGRHLYVVATTGRARDREACLAAGMDDFLSKPIPAAALWGVLDRVAKVV